MLMNTNEVTSARTEWIKQITTKTGCKYVALIKDDCIDKVIPKSIRKGSPVGTPGIGIGLDRLSIQK